MFERYTEKARRTIFFARYEASQFGTPEIESEHLLLGLLREGRGTLNYLLRLQGKEEEMRAAITASSTQQEKTSTSTDLPLTNECKRILAYGAEEASRLGHKHIGIEHLMLGILREKDCLAARILREQGLQLDKTRKLIDATKEVLAANSGAFPSGLRVKVSTDPAIVVEIVDAGTPSVLLRYPDRSMLPRIGESIRIRDAENPGPLYRVQDVIWEFGEDHGDPGSHQLMELKVRVVMKENSD